MLPRNSHELAIEEWELESSASSMDDEEFPLLVEVSDDEDVSENLSLGQDVEEFFDELSKEETEAIDSDTEVEIGRAHV